MKSINNVRSCMAFFSISLASFTASHDEAAAAIRNRYSFSNPAGAAVDGLSIIEDSIGPHDGVVRGAMGTFTGSQMTFPGGIQNAGGAYVDLPNGMVSAISSDATFEAWYTVDVATNWAHLWDFGDRDVIGFPTEIVGAGINPGGGAGDVFYYSPMRASNSNQQRVSVENEHAASGHVPPIVGTVSVSNFFVDTNVTQPVGEQHHVVVTYVRDDNGPDPGVLPRLTVFLDGAQVGTTLATAAHPFQLENLNDINNWLGRSNYSADNMFDGNLNEFRIYDHALTASDVSANQLLGPDIAEPLSLQVNTITGEVKMISSEQVSVPLEAYQISSAAGALSESGWNSFDDQEPGTPPGDHWEEGGASSPNQLSELYAGFSGYPFAPGSERSLGEAFNPAILGAGINGDLVFQYTLGHTNSFHVQLTGSVVYVPEPSMLLSVVSGLVAMTLARRRRRG